MTDIPIWIKLPNFPLCCWNEAGFSKVASRIGIPLAVDNLTATKNRITFARVCVQINVSSPLPSSVSINLNEEKFEQPVSYDWKPSVCHKCATFSHDSSNCPLHPLNKESSRGRSRSRAPPAPKVPSKAAPSPYSAIDTPWDVMATNTAPQLTLPTKSISLDNSFNNLSLDLPDIISDLNQPPSTNAIFSSAKTALALEPDHAPPPHNAYGISTRSNNTFGDVSDPVITIPALEPSTSSTSLTSSLKPSSKKKGKKAVSSSSS